MDTSENKSSTLVQLQDQVEDVGTIPFEVKENVCSAEQNMSNEETIKEEKAVLPNTHALGRASTSNSNVSYPKKPVETITLDSDADEEPSQASVVKTKPKAPVPKSSAPSLAQVSNQTPNQPARKIIRVIRQPGKTGDNLPLSPHVRLVRLPLGPDSKPLPRRILPNPTSAVDGVARTAPVKPVILGRKQSKTLPTKPNPSTSTTPKVSTPSTSKASTPTTTTTLRDSPQVILFTPSNKQVPVKAKRLAQTPVLVPETKKPHIKPICSKHPTPTPGISELSVLSPAIAQSQPVTSPLAPLFITLVSANPTRLTVPSASVRGREISGKCLALDCIVRKNPRLRIGRRKLPVNQPTKAREWLISAGRSDLLPRLDSEPDTLRNSTLCELHFSDSQFMNPLRKQLIKGAVPALFGKYTLTLANHAKKTKDGVEWSQKAAKQGSNMMYSLSTATRNATTLRSPHHTRRNLVQSESLIKSKLFVTSSPFHKVLKQFWDRQEFTDMVLACPGWQRKVHKVVLAAASPFFRTLLDDPLFAYLESPCLILDNHAPWELELLLKYIYQGQVTVSPNQVMEVQAFFAELQIGRNHLPPAPPINGDCVDLSLRTWEGNTLTPPPLPFETGSRLIYGYAVSPDNSVNRNRALDKAPSNQKTSKARQGDNFDFIEKTWLKGAEDAKATKKQTQLRFTFPPIKEEVGDATVDGTHEDNDINLFTNGEQAEVSLPPLDSSIECKAELKEPEPPTEFDILREETEAQTNPRLSTLLKEIYSFQYTSPFLRSPLRSGYPSPKLPINTQLLSGNPIPKQECRNYQRAQRQAVRRAKIRQERLAQEEAEATARKAARAAAPKSSGKTRKPRKKPRTSTRRSTANARERNDSDVTNGQENEAEASEAKLSGSQCRKTRLFICEYCGKSIKSKTSFRVHLQIHLGIFPHKCDLCSKQFRTRRNLRVHLDMHNGVRKHPCDICGGFFLTNEQLRVHRRVHTGEKPYKCNFCDKRFRVRGGVLAHMRTHTKEKPFACSICQMNFNSHKKVNEHKVHHTQENRKLRDPNFFYHCGNCRYYYCRTAHVTEHTCESAGQSETGLYLCGQCNKRFESEELAHSHVVNVHNNQVIPMDLTCQTCSATFESAHELCQHAKNEHITRSKNYNKKDFPKASNGSYKCRYCRLVFEDEELWGKHQKTHEQKETEMNCPTCGKTFRTRKQLSQHQLGHLEKKPYACKQCDKSYVTRNLLENHVNRIHLNIKPYKCPVCDRTFSGYGNFSRHKYRHTDVRRCQQCGRVFDSMKGLTQHELMHETGELTGKNRGRLKKMVKLGSPENETADDGVAADTPQVELFQPEIVEGPFEVEVPEENVFNEGSFYVVMDTVHLS